MKRPRQILGSLLAILLTVASLHAVAETRLGGRDFDHMTTGFQLSGGHATAACETCHVGGVFKGTPKNCDGCHALGKRVVATPKSTNHIVTDAPCESCHFNTSTFLGARYNHSLARPGDCASCHNGRIAKGKHAGHVPTTYSCDQCHRTSSWIPASWNHTNNALATYSGQPCMSCHNPSGLAKNKIQSAGHLPLTMAGVTFADCGTCHKSYYSFFTAFYDHAGAPSTCESCHGTFTTQPYSNVKHPTAPIHSALLTLPVTTTCNACHKSFGTFSGAKFDHLGATQCSVCHSGTYSSFGIRGKSANHIPYSATECSTCHSAASWANLLKGAALHAWLSGNACTTCHASGSPYIGGRKMGSHEGFNGSTPDCSSSNCHRPAGGKGSAYTKWD